MGLLLLLLMPVALIAWVVGSESGMRQAVTLVNRFADGQVVVGEPVGRLVDEVRLGTVSVRLPALKLDLQGVQLSWRPAALLDQHLQVDLLAADSVAVASKPSDAPSEPPAMPALFALPGSLDLSSLRVGVLRSCPWVEGVEWVCADAPTGSDAADPGVFEVRALQGALRSDGAVHQVVDLAAELPFGRVGLAGQIDSNREAMPLDFAVTLAAAFEGRQADLNATVSGDLRETVLDLDAHAEGVQAQVEVVAAPFAPMPLSRVRASASGIDPAVFAEGAPSAALTVQAELAPLAGQGWTFAGPVRIDNARPGPLDQNAIPLLSVETGLTLSQSAAAAKDLVIMLPGGGRIEGALDWRADPQAAGPGQLDARLVLQGIDPSQLQAGLPAAILQGQLDAAGDLEQQTASLDVQLGEAKVQLQAVLRVLADGRSFETSGRIEALNPAAFVPDAPQAALNLDLKAAGRIAEQLELGASWMFAPSTIESLPLQGKGALTMSGPHLSAVDIDLAVAGNRVLVEGGWGRAEDSLRFDLDAGGLAALGKAFKLALDGRARLQGTVAGSIAQPRGAFTLTGEGLALPGDVHVDAINGQGQLEAGLDGQISVSLGLTGVGPGGEASGQEDWLEKASLLIKGKRDEHVLELNLNTPDADALSVVLSGGLTESPTGQPGWSGEIVQLETQGRLPLKLTAPAQLTIAANALELGAAKLDAGEKGQIALEQTRLTPAEVLARGSVSGLIVDLVSSENRRRPVRDPLTLGAEWDVRLGKVVEGQARVFRESGDLRIPGELNTRLGLDALEVRANLERNRVAVSVDGRGAEFGELTGSATLQLERSAEGVWSVDQAAPLLGSARLNVPSIAWVSRLIENEMELGGALAATLTLSGSVADPVAVGQISGEGLSVVLLEHGVSLSGGELLAEFEQDRLRLTRLAFIFPNGVQPGDVRVPVEPYTRTPGSLIASGEVALDSGEGRFRFDADRLPVLQRADRWMILSGRGEAQSSWTGLVLNADFGVDSAFVELAETPPPSLSDDVVITTREPPPGGGGMSVNADVKVSLGEHLYLSALGLDTRLTGDLLLRMRPGEALSATGSLATVGGVFKGYGQNLTIDRGLINFQGPLDNPGLNIVALRKGLAVEAGVSVGGSARRPQIRLVSEPNVPDPEKLSWIAFGRAPSGGSGADMGALLPVAQALLGGSGGGMTDQLSKSLGFDEFGIGQGELNSASRSQTSRVVGSGSTVTNQGTVSGQVLTLGKRLSSDLFVSFEQSLGGAESLIKLTYQLSRSVSLVARSGTDNSADMYYTVSFR